MRRQVETGLPLLSYRRRVVAYVLVGLLINAAGITGAVLALWLVAGRVQWEILLLFPLTFAAGLWKLWRSQQLIMQPDDETGASAVD